MSRRPKSPCRKCKELHRNKSGFCDKHESKGNWRAWADRKGNERERGYDSKWKKLARSIRIRDCNLCQPCKRVGRLTEACAVDHIIPKHKGGTDAESNLQSICKRCHDRKTATER